MSRDCQAKLSTKFGAKPAWFRWTGTDEAVMHQEKWMLRNHSTMPIKSPLHRSAASLRKKTTEEAFHRLVRGEVDKVVDIKAK